MKSIALSVFGAAALSLTLAIPSVSAATNTNHKTTKTTAAARRAWAPQTISGTITIVDPAQKLVVIQTASGIPYDLDITGRTKIMNGNQSVALPDLKQDLNANVSVRLIPERRGDVATSIQIGG